ncbi:hypothetical protein CDL15_Pgr026562 [Punica granatum]|uniref:Uncharacterized protein n=1 Tax=Punica granatum TaxID=22663 RepID=A0A218WLL0_PUNGR|nr:hypothetical protein CDL15_Pgr026562 [Punica granatum]
MSSVSIGGVLQHTRIPPTLHELKITDQRELLSPQTCPEDPADSPRAEDNGPTGASLTPNMAVQAELANLRAERDHLRREVAEKDEQLVDQRQLQRELAQARAEL